MAMNTDNRYEKKLDELTVWPPLESLPGLDDFGPELTDEKELLESIPPCVWADTAGLSDPVAFRPSCGYRDAVNELGKLVPGSVSLRVNMLLALGLAGLRSVLLAYPSMLKDTSRPDDTSKETAARVLSVAAPIVENSVSRAFRDVS